MLLAVLLAVDAALQPFVEVSCATAVSYALVNQAGVARGLGELARAHALLDESRARFEAATPVCAFMLPGSASARRAAAPSSRRS